MSMFSSVAQAMQNVLAQEVAAGRLDPAAVPDLSELSNAPMGGIRDALNEMLPQLKDTINTLLDGLEQQSLEEPGPAEGEDVIEVTEASSAVGEDVGSTVFEAQAEAIGGYGDVIDAELENAAQEFEGAKDPEVIQGHLDNATELMQGVQRIMEQRHDSSMDAIQSLHGAADPVDADGGYDGASQQQAYDAPDAPAGGAQVADTDAADSYDTTADA
jgi:hypothetical protein